MALPSDYRWIAVGQLAVRNRANAPDYAPDFEISDLIAALKDRISRREFHRPYARGARLMWCASVAEDDDYFRLILQVADKNVSGTSFVHFETMETRDIEKDEDEGGHYSAHMLIGKTADQLGRHLILIEKVPGIFLSSVKAHFAWVCKQGRYANEAEDGDGNLKRFHAVFDIVGHQSRTIREALRTGTLQDIEFVSNEEFHDDGLDEDPIVKEVIHEASWKVKKRVTEDQARNVFDRVTEFLPTFRGGADDTQIFVRIKADNGQIRRTEVHHDGDEILEQAFVQNEMVSDFDPPLTQRYENFRSDMIRKMRSVADNLGD